MSNFINLDTPFFNNDTGAPLALGKAYFGEPNQDPKTNPKAPYSSINPNVATTATQTLTSAGKLAQRTYLIGDYSLTVDDADGNQILNYSSVKDDSGLSAWVLFSGTPTRTSNTTFTLTGDQTSTFTAGTRLKLEDSSTLYGIVTVSAYTSLTTVTVRMDSGSLSGSLSSVYTPITDTVSKPISISVISDLPTYNIQNGKYGAILDGSADDTSALQAVVNDISTNFDTSSVGAIIELPAKALKISSTVEIPPGIIIKGQALFNGTNANPGSIIVQAHDGAGLRFIRKAAATTLTHNGGIASVAFNGLGASATTSQRFIELGDPSNVDTNNGAWNGYIKNCLFNSTYGYGIYSAHSQSWRIEGNYFRSIRYGVHYNTVSASARIIGNDFECSAASLNAYAITLQNGTLGGGAGAIIRDNYIIGPKVGIYMSNQTGTIVTGNTIEGAEDECIYLNRYLRDGVTLDANVGTGFKNGCRGFYIEGNTFINWCADGAGSNSAIQLSSSGEGWVGHQAYMSPNGSAGPAIGVYEDAGHETEENIIVEPRIIGSNAGTVLPYAVANSIIQKNTMIRRDGIKLALKNAPQTLGASDRGFMYLDSNNLPMFHDGAGEYQLLRAADTIAGSAGASAGYITINIDGTDYKLEISAVS